MLSEKLQKILIVDGKDQHLEETNAFVIHPKKLGLATVFQKESFEKAIIKNTPSEYLKSLGFFNISQALKKGGICEVYVDQPIGVMQSVEAEEVEANAKLGGFTSFNKQDYEEWVKQGETDVKIQTIKLSMIKAAK